MMTTTTMIMMKLRDSGVHVFINIDDNDDVAEQNTQLKCLRRQASADGENMRPKGYRMPRECT